MKLRCLGRYSNPPHALSFHPGDVFDADDSRAAFLFADAPECFEIVAPERKPGAPDTKALDGPPADKAIQAPPRKK